MNPYESPACVDKVPCLFAQSIGPFSSLFLCLQSFFAIALPVMTYPAWAERFNHLVLLDAFMGLVCGGMTIWLAYEADHTETT